MKNKFIIILSLIFSLFVLCIFSFAHPGNTDENGGHYDWETGEYHYHHGYPAHQHINGECPYNFDDQTDYSSGSSYYYDAEYEKELAEQERIEADEQQGAHAGELLGIEKGKKAGKEAGLSNDTFKLPKVYSPMYANNGVYEYDNASYEYKRAFAKSFETAYNEAYEEGYEEGHSIWQENHDKTVKIIIWSIVIALGIVILICLLVHHHKQKQKEKVEELARKLRKRQQKIKGIEEGIRQEQVLKLLLWIEIIKNRKFECEKAEAKIRYCDKSYDELIDLPKGVVYCNGTFAKKNNDTAFTVYKNIDSYILHSRKGCGNAFVKYDIFQFAGKHEYYRMCRRCGKQEHIEIINHCPEWYQQYLNINADLQKYGIELKEKATQLQLPLE